MSLFSEDELLIDEFNINNDESYSNERLITFESNRTLNKGEKYNVKVSSNVKKLMKQSLFTIIQKGKYTYNHILFG